MLQADLDNAEIHLDLWPGMEYMLDECFSDFADHLQPLGDTRLLLCEAPPQAHPGIVQECLELILEKGFVPLIAHPERTQYFYESIMRRAARLAKHEEHADFEARHADPVERPIESKGFLKKLWPFASRSPRPASRIPRHESFDLPEKCLFQANLGSFTGFYGEKVQRQAYELLKLGSYAALASDLHDGGSASKVLGHDKIETNPFLKKLAEFDGSTRTLQMLLGSDAGRGQGELF